MTPFLSDHALVLGSTRYRDFDLILDLFTLSHGRIKAFARSALRSQKRFGGSTLEPLNHIKVQIRQNSKASGENVLHQLDSADLLNSFLGLRQNYQTLERSLFVARLLSDFLNEDHAEPTVFKSFGRWLKVLEQNPKNSREASLFFWHWVLRQQGFFDFDNTPLLNQIFDGAPETQMLWQHALKTSEPNFELLFDELFSKRQLFLDPNSEKLTLESMTQHSGVHWTFVERSLTL